MFCPSEEEGEDVLPVLRKALGSHITALLVWTVSAVFEGHGPDRRTMHTGDV